MLGAKAYKDLRHDLLIVDAERLVRSRLPRIRLLRMNRVCTKPFPHPRDINLFQRIEDFPFDTLPAKEDPPKTLAELCVIERVDNVAEAVIDVIHGTTIEVMEQ